MYKERRQINKENVVYIYKGFADIENGILNDVEI